MLLNLARLNKDAVAKDRTAMMRNDLENKIKRFDKINAAKAKNKHGLMNRLNIDENKHSKLSRYLKEQQINK